MLQAKEEEKEEELDSYGHIIARRRILKRAHQWGWRLSHGPIRKSPVSVSFYWPISDSAWASDNYALVRGRFTITKSGKRVHCAFLEQSLFSSQSFNQIPSNPACWPSKARLGDPRIRLISFPSKRGTAWQRDLPTSDLKNPIYSSRVKESGLIEPGFAPSLSYV